MNNLSTTVKMLRKQYNLTQEELSLKSGVGLRFVRDLEQGKETLRLDKVTQLLDFFKYEMVATQKTVNNETSTYILERPIGWYSDRKRCWV